MLVPNAVRGTREHAPPEALMARYSPEDLAVFTPAEQSRWLWPLGITSIQGAEVQAGWPCIRKALAWQLLYRVEPNLYGRLVAGENIHPAVLDWLPRAKCAVEVGAGLGRLTVDLARRAAEVIAVEPAATLRERLCTRLRLEGLTNIRCIEGFFDDIPLPDDQADLVVACSSFSVESKYCGERGLAEMERICRPGGIVAIIWPDNPDWLSCHGYTHVSFAGEMYVTFASLDEALELARIFYPASVAAIEEGGNRMVSFHLLGLPAPRDFCWKKLQ